MMNAIHGFWTGPISEVELVSMKSFMSHGHDYHLWGYGQKPTNLPADVIWCDASKIVPFDEFIRWMRRTDLDHIKQSFANYFRYKLLYSEGGFWCDLDVICLKPFDFDQDYKFCNIPDIPTRKELHEYYVKLGPYGHFVNTVILSPPKSPLLGDMIEEIEASSQIPSMFGTWGAVLLTKHILRHGLEDYGTSDFFTYGMSYARRQFDDVTLPIPDCYAIHLFNYMNFQRGKLS